MKQTPLSLTTGAETRLSVLCSEVMADMMLIAGYQTIACLYESATSTVYRGQRDSDQQPVILKMLRADYPRPEELARFIREYELTRSLADVAGVIQVDALESYQHTYLMVIEDFGGESLNRLLRFSSNGCHCEESSTKHPSLTPSPNLGEGWGAVEIASQSLAMTLSDILRLFIRIAEILGRLHRRNIIHKDLNPSNIVWNPATDQVKIIDFGISSALASEQPEIQHPSMLEGTLAYMSPEQTGRMNRVLDYRTDLYSLGATMYHLLTGQLPFPTDDVMAMVHCHLAQMPVLPCDLTPEPSSAPFPCREGGRGVRFLSAIILKLMAKNAEDRYQSAEGLQADLEECLAQLHAPGTSEVPGTFALGQHDRPEKFQIPQKLYGREPEVHLLLQAFERVSVPPSAIELILITGYAGIGKSALVHEIHKPITAQRGYFITGKFDQLQRNLPYFALIQAFQGLLRQLLAEPEPLLARWRTDIVQAIGANGRVLLEVIPELELLLGPQPDIPALPPTQAQNRFHFVFQNFVRACAAAEHPLVLFLDDLQWADAASLKLIEFMLNDPALRFLLLMGAYRENEVTDVHPVRLAMRNIQQAGIPVTTLTLTPLPLEQVTRLLADALKVEMQVCAPIAEAVYRKTGGNPFFLRQFLYALYAEKVIGFNQHLRSWQVNLLALEQQGHTANVLDLMIAKLRRLPDATQYIVQLAACIGNQFDLHTLATVAERAPAATLKALWEALQDGLVVPLDDTYKYAAISENWPIATPNTKHQIPNTNFKFLHDRVQQAAYDLIADADKQAIHLRIGQLLRTKTSEVESEEQIFEVVNHLNLGQDMLTVQAERDQLAELNLQAGKKAKASAAYHPALIYFQQGIALLTGEFWQRQYDLALALYTEAAETASLCGQFDVMEVLAQQVLQQAQTLLDQVPAYEIFIHAEVIQNRLPEAVRIMLQVLKLLGVRFPERPTIWHVGKAFLLTKIALFGKPIDMLGRLPSMSDSYNQIITRILATSGGVAYLTTPMLAPLFTFEVVKRLVKYGNNSIVSMVYASYGFVLCGFVGDITAGYQFGQLALRLMHERNAREFEVKTYYLIYVCINHWKQHIKDTLPFIQQACQRGLEIGDFEFAGYCASAFISSAWLSGQALTEVVQQIVVYDTSMREVRQEVARLYLAIDWQSILNLMNNTSDHSADSLPWMLVGDVYNEERMVPIHLQTQDHTALFSMYCNKLFLSYLFYAYSQAMNYVTLAKTYLEEVTGLFFFPLFHFLESLAFLAIYEQFPYKKQRQISQRIASNQKKMRKWAHHAPMNHLHKWYLVEAERARVSGRDAKAGEYYDQAIALAHEHQYLHEAALANELAGRFYLAQGRVKIAQTYLKEARYGYLTWGAHAKVRHLDQTYPELLLDTPSRRVQLTLTDTTPANISATVLDVAAMMKASQAISGEIVLAELLQKMLRIVLATAGAQKGLLLLEQSGTYTLEAESTVANPEVKVLLSIPLESAGDVLATAIVQYVARAKTPVVLADAAHEGAFVRDRYVTTRQPQSILCLPLIKQGRVTAILYLENNLTTGAFTADRLEVLTMLAGQMAIALDNAQLYATLEAKVRERTQALEAQQAQLRQSEHQARRLQELAEAANQAKTEFLSRVNHELRIPLNSILGYLQLFKQDAAFAGPYADALETMYQSSYHLLGLINDLLDLAKIEARKIELTPAPFHLPDFLKHLSDIARIGAQQKGLAFISDLAPDLPVMVLSDEHRLRQIVLNLLNNAIKFTDHGRVTLRILDLRFEIADLEDQQSKIKNLKSKISEIRFEVADTGIGIPAPHLPHIFVPFYQVKDARIVREGTGLGLAISQQLARMLGSAIQVTSVADQGSTFWFDLELPVVAEQPQEVRNAAPQRIVGFTGPTPCTILVADDQSQSRALVKDFLSPLGFTILEAENGEEALTLARQIHPEVILMDVLMPQMDGLEATRRIRALETRNWKLETEETASESSVSSFQFPVIIGFSANVSPTIREECLAAGCDDFLPKPFQLEALLALLQRHLRLEWQYAAPAVAARTTPDVARAAPLVVPPPEYSQDLLNLAKDGVITDIRRALARIRALDACYNPWVDRLELLANNFQFEQMIALINLFRMTGETHDPRPQNYLNC